MVNITIVEDSPEAREKLTAFVKQYGDENHVDFSLKTYEKGIPFIEEYSLETDVVFFDIQLPDSNGMDLAKKIREKDGKVIIVFITFMAQYALTGYEVEALDFIVKPVDYGSFKMKMQRVMDIIEKRNAHYIAIHTIDRDIARLNLNEVEYVEVLGHNVTYHTLQDTFVCNGSLGQVEKELNPYFFEKCANSFLVNLRFVKKVEGDTLFLTKDTLTISRGKRKAFLMRLADYYSGGSL